MEGPMKVVVVGATGVVGRAAAEHFADRGHEVLGVSRRDPALAGVVHVPVDLTDAPAALATFQHARFDGVTHVVYCALQESPELVAGWRDRELMARNLAMFRAALGPLASDHGDTLRHVSLLQGAKAYGFQVGCSPIPAKERTPRAEHDNFYFLQEDALRELASDAPWSWTILRPQVVYGDSFGSPMNLLPAIGVYAALERVAGRALSFPGGGRAIHEAVDARLLARVLAWAADAPAARDEIFNITNGDVFDWHDVWPSIADALGMDAGEPRAQRLAASMPPRADAWGAIVDDHHLRSPRAMADFVGASWQYADLLFGTAGSRSLPALLSTVKLRHAGFSDCVDTEDMFREWFAVMQERALLPAR
jgi:nucleoside-diphosphate-sugar epimerase